MIRDTQMQFVIGEFTGDGSERRIINLGFKPSLVMLNLSSMDERADNKSADNVIWLYADYYRITAAYGNKNTALYIVENGFTVSDNTLSSGYRWNREGYKYTYIAWR